MNPLIVSLTFYSFINGWANSIIRVLPISIFLSYHSAAEIAIIYMISSAIAPLVGLGLQIVKVNTAPRVFGWISSCFNVILSFSVLIIYILISEDLFAYYFVFMQKIISTQIMFDIDIVTTKFLSIQESKKNQYKLSIGRSLGKLFGNLTLPFLFLLLKAQFTILLLTTLQILLFACNLIMEATNPERILSYRESDKKGSPLNLKTLLSSFVIGNLLFLIFVNFVYRFIELTSYHSLEEMFNSQEKITLYLSYLFILASLTEIFNSTFVFRRFIQYFGVQLGQVYNMLCIVGLTAICGLTYLFVPNPAVILVLIFGSWILYNGGYNVFLIAALNIAYSSLPANSRYSVQLATKFFAANIGTILGNLIFAQLAFLFGYSYPLIFGIIVVVSLVTTAIIYSTKKAYVQNLRYQLKKQVPQAHEIVYTQKDRDFIMESLEHSSPKEALYLLSIAKTQPQDFQLKFVETAFKKEDPFLLKESLDLPLKKVSYHYLEDVRRLAAHKEFSVALFAIKALHRQNERLFSQSEIGKQMMLPAPKNLLGILEALVSEESIYTKQAWDQLDFFIEKHDPLAVKVLKSLSASETKDQKLKKVIVCTQCPLSMRQEALYALPFEGNHTFLLSLLENDLKASLQMKVSYEHENSFAFVESLAKDPSSPTFGSFIPQLSAFPAYKVLPWILNCLELPYNHPNFLPALYFYEKNYDLKSKPPLSSQRLQSIKDISFERLSLTTAAQTV